MQKRHSPIAAFAGFCRSGRQVDHKAAVDERIGTGEVPIIVPLVKKSELHRGAGSSLHQTDHQANA